MRTTVTLDSDVEELLRLATADSELSFKEALNDGLRRGLAHLAPTTPPPPFAVEARPMGLKPGIDPAQMQDLAGDLEAEAFLTSTQRLRQELGR